MGVGDNELSAIEPETTTLPYATPQALVAAITDKVAAVVEAGSPYKHDELRRHLAYDRLLARVFTNEPDRWLLKGAGALLARIPDARHSKDLDIAYAGDLDNAVAALTRAAGLDLGDFFTFSVGPVKAELTGTTPGVRIPIKARVGPKPFAAFNVDLVVEGGLTTTPESIAPLSPIQIEGFAKVQYRAYPVVDHIADKHAAMLETHQGRPSTRYRDLIDLVEIVTSHGIDAQPVSVALFTKYRLRGVAAPDGFESPGPDWPAGYEALAKTVPGFVQQSYPEAAAVASAFLDPILAGRRNGTWNPSTLTWED